MPSKNEDAFVVREPLIDKVNSSTGIGRLLLLGFFLFMAVVALGYFGKDRLGEPAFLVVLGVFASVGIFFLFSLVLGMVQLTSRSVSSEFSERLLGGMDTGIAVTDANGRLVYANRSYADLLGVTEASDISSVETVFSRRPEASEIVYRLANAAKEGNSNVEEFRLASGLKNEDEGARWFRLRARGMNTGGRGKPMIVWNITDVTRDRRRQETAFQELQDAIHYLDHAPAGFLSSEANGSLVYINATLADWLGLDLTRFDAGSINLKDIISGDNASLLENIIPAENGPTTHVIDLDMKKGDGTLLPVRLYHKVTAAIDGAPGTSRTLVLNRAVVDSDEDALRDSEVRFARFFNSTPVAIAGINRKGRIVRTNAPFQKMFASAVEEHGAVMGMKFQKIVAKSERERLKSAFDAALAGRGDIPPVDLVITGETDRHVRFFVNPIAETGSSGDAGSGENEEQVIVYAMETTEQRAMELQVAQGQKMQAVGQLAGGIAHDFNNVLTAIIGFSDLLLNNHKPSDPSFQDIMNIKQNANRAASLVRQLLAFSRRQTLRPQVLHFSDVLSDLRMLLDRLLGEKVELKVKHGRDLWPIKADISQLEQVIVNLAVNARDAMPEGGALELRTRNVSEQECSEKFNYTGFDVGEYVLLEVIDQGTGMSKKVLEQIFEPFFSTKEVGKGTGLGLSTVYGIVKQTGGFIYPDSEEGKGTTFRVFLPRYEQSEEELAAKKPEESEKKEKAKDLTGSSTILLVEDEDPVRAFGSRALVSRGYEVFEAASGVEALEVMEEHGDKIDLVVSDVVMPEMDGPTLLGELRKNYPDLKFIFVSGYAEDAFAKNLPEEEKDKFGFLPKPFSLKQLATTVKEMLEA